MAGETGWARAGGSVTLSGSSPGGLSAGRIRLFAKVPRFAWFHASMVSLTSVLRVRPGAGVLLLSGRGRLVPTVRSPVAASLAITGTGKLELARTKSARNGRLTFALRITNTDPM
jgi:hypothetical protein